MPRLLFILVFAEGLAAWAQSQPPPPSPPPGLRTDAPHRGTNYDPPPMPKPKEQGAIEQPKPAAEKPFIEIPPIDFGARETWIKFTLLVGSVLLALRAFRDMKD